MIAIERRNFRRRPRWLRGLPSDPRIFQITVLGMLLGAGAWLRDFALRPEQCVLTFAAAFATQWLGDRWRGADGGGARSAAITALSLSLLLRADGLWAHPLAAIVAVGAKFVVRVRGKHLFNPGNLGVIFALVAFPGTWVSAGQWGADFVAAGWFVALGGLVVHRARRADVTVAFLGFHAAVLAFRVAWLGQSAGRLAPPAAKRGAVAVRLLHDLRSQDDPGSQRAGAWRMPRWSPRSLTSGSSRSTGRTRCCGPCSWRRPRSRCGTRCGRPKKYQWQIQGGTDENVEVVALDAARRTARGLDLARRPA